MPTLACRDLLVIDDDLRVVGVKGGVVRRLHGQPPECCVDCGIELSKEVLDAQLREILAPFAGTKITPERCEQFEEACRRALSPFFRGASCCCRCAWEISEVIPAGATCPFWLSMKQMDETLVDWCARHPWLYDPQTLVSWRVGNDQPVPRSK